MEAIEQNSSGTRYRRLVIVILLICLLGGGDIFTNENSEDSGFLLEEVSLIAKEEIIKEENGVYHKTPWFYIFFLPGILVFIVIIFLDKRKTSVLLCLYFFLVSSGFSTEEDELSKILSSGESNYKAEEYNKALTSYLQAEALIPGNGLLKYNIGLCYYKLGKPGYSIFYLKEAIRTNPNRKFMKDFLNAEEELYGLLSQVDTTPFFHDNDLFLLFVILFNLSFITLGINIKFKKGSLAILFVFFCVFTLFSFGIFCFNRAHSDQPVGIIIDRAAIIKKIPLDTAGDWLTLKQGTAVQILGDAGEFILIQTSRELKGWIKKENLVYKDKLQGKDFSEEAKVPSL